MTFNVTNIHRVLVAAAVDQPTFYYSVKFKIHRNSSHFDEFESGINVEAFRFICDALNFTGMALKSRGQMHEDENGNVMNQGIVAVLNSDMADIAISLFEPLPYRMAGRYGVRFLHAVFKSSKTVAVFTQPPKTSTRNIFGRPFEENVWQCIFIFTLAAILMTILWILSLKYNSREDLCLTSIISYVKILMVCVFTRQGCFEDLTTVSKSFPVRLQMFVWLITSVVMHSIYSSVLTSIFAADFTPISSFQQLVGKQYTLYYDKYVPSIENIIEDVGRGKKNVTVIEMGKEINKMMKKAAPKIFGSKAALLTTEDRYFPYFDHDYNDSFLCSKLSVIRLPLGTVKNTNFVKQNSPYREDFNRKLLLMKQGGLIERLYEGHEIKTRLSCFKSFESEIVNLDLYDTGLPFLVLLLFSVLGIVILICEIISKRLKQKQTSFTGSYTNTIQMSSIYKTMKQ